MTVAILVIICLLPIAVVVALVLQILFRSKSSTSTPERPTPILGSRQRYRDGAVTYHQIEGVRGRVRIEDPYQPHAARYERRHRPKKHPPTKPWKRERHL